MKQSCKKIGEWLDNAHWDIGQSEDSSFSLAFYEGAREALKVAGYSIEEVPCGLSVVHIVKSNTKE